MTRGRGGDWGLARRARRSVLSVLSVAACVVLASGARAAADETADAPRRLPNIVLILADDLGWADLGCYGQKRIRTPHIDRLAAEGMRFTQYYAGSPVCAPSRSVLLTGLHTGHTRVRGNFAKVGGVGPQGRLPLEDSDLTVAEILKRRGYVTGAAGKWGLGEPETPGVPNRQGFDEWLGYLNQRHAHSYYPEHIWRNEERLELPGNRGGARETYTHDLFTEFALDFIDRHRARPFFLYLPYCIPHARYEVPNLGRWSDETSDVSPDARTYAAMVERLDRDVGRIVERLEACGLSDDTLVLFASDNGAAERWDGSFDSCGPLRGRKRDLWEGGLRVPWIARWDGRIAAGSSSDLVCDFADFLPTVAEIVGEPIEGVDGVSILPTLLRRAGQRRREFLYWEFFERGFQQAIRVGDWKGVRLAPDRPLALYDLANDLGERQDLAAERPEVVARLERLLRQARVPSSAWPSPLDAAEPVGPQSK